MFYTYNQNNSGGGFTCNDMLADNVIIEADNAEEADYIAEGIGIYFDGGASGLDCNCCGDRWYAQSNSWSDAGSEVPTIYGQDVSDGVFSDKYGYGWTDPYAYIHYKDGRVVPVEYRKVEENDNI